MFFLPNLHLQAKRVSTRSTPLMARLVDGLIQCKGHWPALSFLFRPLEESVHDQTSDWEAFAARPQEPTKPRANQQEATNKPKPQKLRGIVRSTIMESTTNTTIHIFSHTDGFRRVASENRLLQSQWRRTVRQLQDVSSMTIRACFPFLRSIGSLKIVRFNPEPVQLTSTRDANYHNQSHKVPRS